MHYEYMGMVYTLLGNFIMKYVGSKRRILKDILPIILKDRGAEQWFVEPMCGSAIVSQHVQGKVIASDINKYLIALLEGVRDGYELPSNVSEKDYYEWKSLYSMVENSDGFCCSSSSMMMIGFVGFCCSYGGKFWGGYARGNDNGGSPRNFADEQRRNLMKRKPLIQHIVFNCYDYRELKTIEAKDIKWGIPPNSLIYMDPPYKNTTGYRTGKFNHEEFWEWCRKKRGEGHTIYVSEYASPDDFQCVWAKPLVSSLTKDTGSKVGVEKLFTL
jgi:DNA adenine methylase